MEFVYKGEVNVVQNQLASFLKTAEMLQVKGLSGDEEDEPVSFVLSLCSEVFVVCCLSGLGHFLAWALWCTFLEEAGGFGCCTFHVLQLHWVSANFAREVEAGLDL